MGQKFGEMAFGTTIIGFFRTCNLAIVAGRRPSPPLGVDRIP